MFNEKLKLAVVQYVLKRHARKEASEKLYILYFNQKWEILHKRYDTKGLLSRNLERTRNGFDDNFSLEVLQYNQERHITILYTDVYALLPRFCNRVPARKKFQKERSCKKKTSLKCMG